MLPEIPIWVGLANAGFCVSAAFAFCALTTLMAARIACGKGRGAASDEHWSEGARRLWAVRQAKAFVVIFSPALAVTIIAIVYLNSALFPWPLLIVAVAVASGLGVYAGGGRFRDAIPAKSNFSGSLLTAATMSVLIYPVFYLAIFFGAIMPSGFSWGGLAWLSAFAALTLGVSKGYGLKLAVRCGLAAPAPDEIRTGVQELAAKLGVKQVSVYIAKSETLNAFAFPWTPAVAFTAGLLASMTPGEVIAIGAHEIGHLTESRATLRARFGLLWLAFVILAAFYVLHSLGISGAGQLIVVAVLARVGLSFAGKFLRDQETRADTIAQKNSGGDERTFYASTLEKLYRLNGMPAVMARKSATHPELYDRLLASGKTPDFPRPEPPPMRRAIAAGSACMVFGLLAMIAFVGMTSVWSASGGHAKRDEILASMVTHGATSRYLAMLGHRDLELGRYERAAAFFTDAALRSEDASTNHHLEAAEAHALAGECAEAAASLQSATLWRDKIAHEPSNKTLASASHDRMRTPPLNIISTMVRACQPLAH